VLQSPHHPSIAPIMSDISPFQKIDKRSILSWGLGLATLGIVLSGGVLAYRQFAESTPDKDKQRPAPIAVERANLPITVSANGTVEPIKVVNVSPKTSGILKELMVDQGDRVKQGQVIAAMDNANLQGQLIETQGKLAEAEASLRQSIAGSRPQEIARAQATLEEMQANLQKLVAGNRTQDIAQSQAQLDSATAIYKKAEDEFRRNQMLLKQGAISFQTLNEKLSLRDSAKANVAAAKEKVSLLQEGTRKEELLQARATVRTQQQTLALLKAGSRPEEIDKARATVLSARGAVQNVKTQIEDTIIKAPFSGIIAFKYADPGAFVTPTTSGSSVSSATSSSILSIVSANRAVCNVAEKNIAKIQVGQQVTIKADANPTKTYKGRVSQIANRSTVEQNVTSFGVKVTLEGGAAEELKAGMNISAEFQVGKLQNALVVPTIAVTRQNNKTGVFVGSPDRPPQFVPITTGVTIDNRTEVKSGLDGSEHILVNNPSSQPPPSQGVSWWKSLFGGSDDQKSGPPPPGGPPGGGSSGPPGGSSGGGGGSPGGGGPP
jgi:HlyD family secretion protein